MNPGTAILETARVNRIMQAIQDVRTIPQQLTFLKRTAVVPAFDNEIMARFNGRVQIADLIADDQRAVTYSAGNMTLEATVAPNLKLGYNLTQSDITNLATINSNPDVANQSVWKDWVNGRVDFLNTGIKQRMEALIVAMKLDAITYNRMGIIISSGGWGMPSDLKVSASTGWANAGSATPANDTLGVLDYARVRYGVNYRRMTLSTAAFRLMIATTEFQAKARQFLAPNVSFVNLPLQLSQGNLVQQLQIANNVLGVEIELYDARYWSQNAQGQFVQAPYLPLGKIILDDPADDNNPQVCDFANGVVTESRVAGMLPGNALLGSLVGEQRGPVAYTTLADAQMNPPGITMWGVARGFPRKFILQSNAVLDIGTVTDTIPTTDPFAPPVPTPGSD